MIKRISSSSSFALLVLFQLNYLSNLIRFDSTNFGTVWLFLSEVLHRCFRNFSQPLCNILSVYTLLSSTPLAVGADVLCSRYYSHFFHWENEMQSSNPPQWTLSLSFLFPSFTPPWLWMIICLLLCSSAWILQPPCKPRHRGGTRFSFRLSFMIWNIYIYKKKWN